MTRKLVITASVFGVLAVIAGAFGAHALKGNITANQLEAWQTAVQYQFYHTFALLYLTTVTRYKPQLVKHAYYLFTIGVVFFSGSLYLLDCIDLLGWTWIPVVAPLTPLGGIMFIAGWAVVGYAAYKIKLH